MPPSLLDGARVLWLAYGDFGRGINDSPIIALAVTHYDDDSADSFYLFACDKNWNVVGDLLYSSAEDAQRHAECYYEVSPIKWQKLESQN